MLETPRLILDAWQSSDWTAFRPIAEDPEVMRYITGGTPWSEEKIRDFVERQMRTYAERGFCRWRLLDRTDGRMVGFCGANAWRDARDPEIGWWLAREFWGRGLATEAARCALGDVFERVRLERVISVAMPANRPSIRIMEKLGLRFQREFQSDNVPLVQYGISRIEFFDLSAAL